MISSQVTSQWILPGHSLHMHLRLTDYALFYHFRELYFSRAGHLWTGPASERILPGDRPLAAWLLSERRLRRWLRPRGTDLTGASHPAVGRPRHQVPPQFWPLQPRELSSHPHRLREREQVWRRIRWEIVSESESMRELAEQRACVVFMRNRGCERNL